MIEMATFCLSHIVCQILLILLILLVLGGTQAAEAAAINITTTTMSAQPQNSATPAPTAASNFILEEVIPKSVLTFIGLAIFVLIGLGIAKLVDRFHDSVELRDDASDISEHTRDLLKARFALFAFTPAKLQSEADRKTKDLERARKFGRIWMVQAAMSRRKKRDEAAAAIASAANATEGFRVAAAAERPTDNDEASGNSAVSLSSATSLQRSAARTADTRKNAFAIESPSAKVKSSTANKTITPANKNLKAAAANTNIKSRPTTAKSTAGKSRPTTAATISRTATKTVTIATSKPSIAKSTSKVGSTQSTAATRPKTAVVGGASTTGKVQSNIDKPKVTLVSYKPKDDGTVDKHKSADEPSSSAAAVNKKTAKRNNDFITIDIQNLDDSTETREGSTIPSTPRATYIDFREVSEDVTIPVRVSTDTAPVSRRARTVSSDTPTTLEPPQPKVAYGLSEFGSDISLRQSVANVANQQPTRTTVKKTPGADLLEDGASGEGLLEITSLSRDNSFDNSFDDANFTRPSAKTPVASKSMPTNASSTTAAAAATYGSKHSKTPAPSSTASTMITAAAKRDSRPVSSRPMTGRMTSSRPLTAGRSQTITQGNRTGNAPPKSAKRGR